MSISVQTHQLRQSSFKQGPVFADEPENITEEGLKNMNEALNTAENLDQLLSHGSATKQPKSLRLQQTNQSGDQSAATGFGSPLKTGTLSATKSPRTVTVNIFNPMEHLDSSDEDECTFHPKINSNAGRIAQRQNLNGATNEMLYRDATDRMAKSNEYQQIEQATIAKSSTTTKIGAKSMKIVLQKLQRSLSNLIKDAEDTEKPGHLSFEGLGRVLYNLGIFQNLEFNNSGDGEKSSLSINHARVKPERLAKEIQFHENVWKICALASIELNCIPSDLVLRIVMTLVEDKTPQADAASFLLEILDAKLESLGLTNERERYAYVQQRDEKKLWSFEKVVSEFRKLFEDRTSFMNTYSSGNVIKEKNTTQKEKQYQFEHRPQINKKSIALDNRYFSQTLLKKIAISETDLKNNKLNERHHRLYKYHDYLKDKKSFLLEARIDEELAPCTFAPKIKPYKNFKGQTQMTNETRGTVGGEGSISPTKSGYFTQALSSIPAPNRHLLLYEVARTYKEKLQQKTYALKKKEEIDDLSYCTFKPKLNDNYESSTGRFQDFYDGVPNGFKKTVDRLHKGDDLRQTKLVEDDIIPRGENYEKNKAAEFNPPTFITRPKIQRQEVLVYVDVSIGPGRTGRIGIHKGDNAKSLALNFARTYSLNATMKESLEKLLQSYIDSYFAQTSNRNQQAEEERQENEEQQQVNNVHKVEEEEDDDEEEDEEEEDDDDEEEEEDEEEDN